MTESQLDPESQARLAAAVAAAEADAMLREAADYERWRARAEQAEAAIERVRAVANELRHKDAVRILAALDGDQPAEAAGFRWHPLSECADEEDDRRQRYTEVLRRWGFLDAVTSASATAALATTDLMAVADAEQAALRKQLAEARQWARHGYEIGQRHNVWSDHGVAPAWLTEGWPPHIDSRQRMQDLTALDTQVRAVAQSPELAAALEEALRTTPAAFIANDPEAAPAHGSHRWDRHGPEHGHRYYYGCALCRADITALLPALVAAVERTYAAWATAPAEPVATTDTGTASGACQEGAAP